MVVHFCFLSFVMNFALENFQEFIASIFLTFKTGISNVIGELFLLKLQE